MIFQRVKVREDRAKDNLFNCRQGGILNIWKKKVKILSSDEIWVVLEKVSLDPTGSSPGWS